MMKLVTIFLGFCSCAALTNDAHAAHAAHAAVHAAVHAVTADSLSSSAAAAYITESRRLQDDYEDYIAYPNGTPVYFEWKGAWYEGEITNYFNGVYTIVWGDDASVEYFDDIETVDRIVKNAIDMGNSDLTYTVNTPVRKYFPADKEWWNGYIVDLKDGSYVVEWSDGSVESYPPGVVMDEMVSLGAAKSTATGMGTGTNKTTSVPFKAEAATEAPTDEDTTEAPTEEDSTPAPTEDLWEVGTEIYKFFPGDDWYWGTITWVENDVYTVVWSDGTKETYDDSDAFDALVDAAEQEKAKQSEDPWDIGTMVYMNVPGKGDLFGEIIAFAEGQYTVRWSDNKVSIYSINDTNQMVDAAFEKANEQDTAASVVEDDPWDDGTAVYKVFPGEGGFFGEIIHYADGQYTIRWSDNTVEFYAVDETDAMVEAAYEKVTTDRAKKQTDQLEANNGPSPAARFGLVVLILVVLAALAYCVHRRRTGIEKDTLKSNGKSTNLAPTSYKDEPSDADPPVEEIPDVI